MQSLSLENSIGKRNTLTYIKKIAILINNLILINLKFREYKYFVEHYCLINLKIKIINKNWKCCLLTM